MPRKLIELKVPMSELNDYIKQYHSEGKCSREIGELVGCSEDSIRRRLKNLNLSLAFYPDLKITIPNFYKKIKTLYSVGLSCTKIGILLNVTTDAIINNLRKIGVYVPKGANYTYNSTHDEYIKRRYLDGVPARIIAIEINKHHSFVIKHLKKMNIKLNDKSFYSDRYSKERKGENNPAWRGGVSDENALFRASKEYNNWRNQVYIRDNFSCQKCGKNRDLNAHHIKPFALFPTERLEIDNGVTLCKDCHKELHREKGYGEIIMI